MKKVLTSLVASLALLASVVAPSGTVWAEGSESRSALEVTPSGAKITLAPGETLEGNAANCPVGGDGCTITVNNIGTGAVKFRVHMSPYTVRGEKNELSFSEEDVNEHTQLYQWITVQNPDGEYVKEAIFSAEPGQSVKVPFRIEVPEEIPGGSQYAVIWAQIMNEGTAEGIQTVGQVGAVLSGRSTVDSVESAEISEYDFTKFAFQGPLHASATVTNTGNVDFPVNYTYVAKTLFGKELYRSPVDFVAAYPGTTYHINMDWEDTPFLGIFQVEWTVVAADTSRAESAVVIVMPIVVIIVIVLLLTVIIVWIIIISRKRKERKARKLV